MQVVVVLGLAGLLAWVPVVHGELDARVVRCQAVAALIL
jgi:hypothetical protein